jgi:hypothetical protein
MTRAAAAAVDVIRAAVDASVEALSGATNSAQSYLDETKHAAETG